MEDHDPSSTDPAPPIRPGTRVLLPDTFLYLLGDYDLEGEVVELLPRDRVLVRTAGFPYPIRAWVPSLRPMEDLPSSCH